ncbi:hypothetical protein A9Q84_02940 [Halobacteriovorax marinus]|uniref:Secreted protein n=1 Tax=Halobacteriovorax marinus TaxID=97084 RepID=A0A1Y5FII7_9BACT|nr:hypothetical protein A9Q84_02940 [Halobacteriovorax marinus]
MNKTLIALLAFNIFIFNSFAARDIFEIKNLSVETQKTDGLVQGKLEAQKLYIKYGKDTFEAGGVEGLIEGQVEIIDKVFKAKTSLITYTTQLEADNPLVTLDELLIENANLNLNKDEAFFEIPKIRILMDKTTLETESLRGSCDPKGDTTTDIDIVCLQNGNIHSPSVHFINDSMNLLTRNLNTTITPELISLDSAQTIFTSDGQKTKVNILQVRCKNGITGRFKEEDFIAGCFNQSSFYLDGFSEFKNLKKLKSYNPKNTKALVDLKDIKNLRVSINNHNVSVTAKIKILFTFKLKVRGIINYLVEEDILKLEIKKASIAGIPAKSLTMMILKLFLEEDSIRIDGDTIYISV